MYKMNTYQNEPSAPPRRKRSLSSSRFDTQESYFNQQHQLQQQYSIQQIRLPFQHLQQQGYGNGNNPANLQRMRATYSEEHIPAIYLQTPNFHQQQQLIRPGFNNRGFNYPLNAQTNSLITDQNYQPNPQTNPLITAQNFPPNQKYSQQYPYQGTEIQQQQQFYQPNNQNYFDQQILIDQQNSQFLDPNLQQGIRQPTTTINNQPSLLFPAMAGPLNRYNNNRYASGMNFSPMNASSYARPNYDHLKSNNVYYNPYQSKFNPTLMAKPSLDGYQSAQISPPITTAIATRRDPKYSSKEKLDLDLNNSSLHQVRFAQTKTPPARPPPPKLNSRLSLENLSSSPTSGGLNSLNNEYAEIDKNRARDRRSLSPTRVVPPGGIQHPYSSRPTSPLPTTGMNSPSFTPQLSRASSRPGSRTPSREPSPIRTFLNYSKNLFSPKSVGNRSTFFADSDSNSKSTSNIDNFESHKSLFSNKNSMNELQVPDNLTAKHMSELKNSDLSANNRYVTDHNFSKAFTDHCDQYKSVTSKILGGRKNKMVADYSLGAEDFHPTEEFMINKSKEPSPYSSRNEINAIKSDPMMINEKLIHESVQTHEVQSFAAKLGEKLLVESKIQEMRRNSSSNSPNVHQRKASLPAEYIASNAAEHVKLNDNWRRENVAHLAHEARERKLHPENPIKQKIKKIGIWCTKQFIFILICALNIALAYMFYNLINVLPN